MFILFYNISNCTITVHIQSTHVTSKLYSYDRLFQINPLIHNCNVGVLKYFSRESLILKP